MPKVRKLERAWTDLVEGVLDRELIDLEEEGLRQWVGEIWDTLDKGDRKSQVTAVEQLAWLAELPTSPAVEATGETMVRSFLHGHLDDDDAPMRLMEKDDPAVALHEASNLVLTRSDAVAARALLSADPGAGAFDADGPGAGGIGEWEDALAEIVRDNPDAPDFVRLYALVDAWTEGLEANWARLSGEERAAAVALFTEGGSARPSLVAKITGTPADALPDLMRFAFDEWDRTMPASKRDHVQVWIDVVEAVSDMRVRGDDKKALKAEAKALWAAMTPEERQAEVAHNRALVAAADSPAGGGVEAAGEDALLHRLYAAFGPTGMRLMEETLERTGFVGWSAEAGVVVTGRDAQAAVAFDMASPDDDTFRFTHLVSEDVEATARSWEAAMPGLEGWQVRDLAALDVWAEGLESAWGGLSRADRATMLDYLNGGQVPEDGLIQAVLGARTPKQAAEVALAGAGLGPTLEWLPEEARLQEVAPGLHSGVDAMYLQRYGDVLLLDPL